MLASDWSRLDCRIRPLSSAPAPRAPRRHRSPRPAPRLRTRQRLARLYASHASTIGAAPVDERWSPASRRCAVDRPTGSVGRRREQPPGRPGCRGGSVFSDRQPHPMHWSSSSRSRRSSTIRWSSRDPPRPATAASSPRWSGFERWAACPAPCGSHPARARRAAPRGRTRLAATSTAGTCDARRRCDLTRAGPSPRRTATQTSSSAARRQLADRQPGSHGPCLLNFNWLGVPATGEGGSAAPVAGAAR